MNQGCAKKNSNPVPTFKKTWIRTLKNNLQSSLIKFPIRIRSNLPDPQPWFQYIIVCCIQNSIMSQQSIHISKYTEAVQTRPKDSSIKLINFGSRFTSWSNPDLVTLQTVFLPTVSLKRFQKISMIQIHLKIICI